MARQWLKFSERIISSSSFLTCDNSRVNHPAAIFPAISEMLHFSSEPSPTIESREARKVKTFPLERRACWHKWKFFMWRSRNSECLFLASCESASCLCCVLCLHIEKCLMNSLLSFKFFISRSPWARNYNKKNSMQRIRSSTDALSHQVKHRRVMFGGVTQAAYLEGLSSYMKRRNRRGSGFSLHNYKLRVCFDVSFRQKKKLISPSQRRATSSFLYEFNFYFFFASPHCLHVTILLPLCNFRRRTRPRWSEIHFFPQYFFAIYIDVW